MPLRPYRSRLSCPRSPGLRLEALESRDLPSVAVLAPPPLDSPTADHAPAGVVRGANHDAPPPPPAQAAPAPVLRPEPLAASRRDDTPAPTPTALAAAQPAIQPAVQPAAPVAAQPLAAPAASLPAGLVVAALAPVAREERPVEPPTPGRPPLLSFSPMSGMDALLMSREGQATGLVATRAERDEMPEPLAGTEEAGWSDRLAGKVSPSIGDLALSRLLGGPPVATLLPASATPLAPVAVVLAGDARPAAATPARAADTAPFPFVVGLDDTVHLPFSGNALPGQPGEAPLAAVFVPAPALPPSVGPAAGAEDDALPAPEGAGLWSGRRLVSLALAASLVAGGIWLRARRADQDG